MLHWSEKAVGLGKVVSGLVGSVGDLGMKSGVGDLKRCE